MVGRRGLVLELLGGLGPWNTGENWETVSDPKDQSAVDGGDGTARVKLNKAAEAAVTAAAVRTASNPNATPRVVRSSAPAQAPVSSTKTTR